MKIKENREKMIAQRLKEEKEQEIARKQMESEDENEDSSIDEFSDGEKNFSGVISDQENKTNQENNEEKTEEETKNDNEDVDDDDENEDSDHNDSESSDIDHNGIHKPRKRIIAMDDSDDDSIQQIPTNSESFIFGIC